MHFRALFPLAMLGTAIGMIAACSERVLLTAPELETLAPSADVVDGTHNGGNSGFFWLRPLATPPVSFTGQFDPNLPVEVRICNWRESLFGGAGGCQFGNEVFRTTAGQGSETVRVQTDEEHYVINWNTKDVSVLIPPHNTFRVRVRVGTYELGHVDLKGVDDGSLLQDVDSDAFFGFVLGKTVAIKFRVEQGAVPPSSGDGLITAGGGHSCAIGNDATTYCWGWNAYGQTGNNLGFETLTPTPIFAASIDFSQLVAGKGQFGVAHTCGLVRPGVAFCWGSNNLGELGVSGFGAGSFPPQAVSGGHIFVALTAGASFTCGLTDGGVAYCWGSMYGGSTPVAVAGGHSFKALSAGSSHICGIRIDGSAYCWGQNAAGQLGDGNQVAGFPGLNPVPVAVAGGLIFDKISAGGSHTCALTSDGDAYCWGRNVAGTGGTGSYAPDFNLVPVPVAGGLKFVSLSAGGNHNCGFTADGTAYCWGGNSSGQVGNGTTSLIGPNLPTAVSGSAKYASISAGTIHTCAITKTGEAQCWGNNDQGRLGTGNPTASSTPVPVSGDLLFHTR